MLAVLLLVVLTWCVLWRTPFGLRLRSCGESPQAAESPRRQRATATSSSPCSISGALAGLGGGFLALVASSSYRDGQTGGRGYIGLAAMIFGNWRPGGLLAGLAACSATPRRLGLRAGRRLRARAAAAGRGAALVALAIWQCAPAAASAPRSSSACSRSLLLRAGTSPTDAVPSDFTGMTPYVITLLVLAFASQRLRMPEADGQIYRKGSAG